MPTVDVGVQYNDFRGAAAADDADSHSIRHALTERGLIGDREVVVGCSLYVFERRSEHPIQPSVEVFVVDIGEYPDLPTAESATPSLPMRKIELEIALEDFFAMFKRFNLVLERRGAHVIGRNYEDETSSPE